MASMLCNPVRAEWKSYKKSTSRRGETDNEVPSTPRKKWPTVRKNADSETHSTKSRGSVTLRRRTIFHLGPQSGAGFKPQRQNGLSEPTIFAEIRHAERREEKRQGWKEQTENTRKLFNNLTSSQQDPELRRFAFTLSGIIEHWQYHAKDKDPTEFSIRFNEGPLTATLLQVFALVPEEYQEHILVDDTRLSEGGNRSWLHESVMNILVHAQIPHNDQQPQPVVFSPSLTSCARERLDVICQQESKKSWLQHFVGVMKTGAPQNEWNSEKVYTFHPLTERIVYFWNYRENHWTLLTTDINPKVWTHTLYNSYSMLKTVRAWTDATTHMPHLEKLIRGASCFPKPKQGAKYELGQSAQQVNGDDCGIITVYNAVELLNGRIPQTIVDTKSLRLHYLQLILVSLQDMLERGLNPEDNDCQSSSPKSSDPDSPNSDSGYESPGLKPPSSRSNHSNSCGPKSSRSQSHCPYESHGSYYPAPMSPDSGSHESESYDPKTPHSESRYSDFSIQDSSCGLDYPDSHPHGLNGHDSSYYEGPVPEFPGYKLSLETNSLGYDSTGTSRSTVESYEDDELFALIKRYRRSDVPSTLDHEPCRVAVPPGNDLGRDTSSIVAGWEEEGLLALNHHFRRLGADVTDRLFYSLEKCNRVQMGITETEAFRNFCDALFLMMNPERDL